MSFMAGEAFVRLRLDSSKLSAGFGRIASQIGSMAARTGALLAPLTGGALFTGAIIQGAAFERSMSKVGAITGATSAQLQLLSQTAQELGRTTQFSASQAADAMASLALAGFSVNETIASMPATLNLAAAGQLDMASAADIVAKTMRGMEIEADQLESTVDILTQAFVTSNTDLTQLGEALKYVGPVANASGKSLEETVAALQALSNAGLQASLAGTSLRGILGKLSTSAVQKNFHKLGISVVDANGSLKPMAQIIDETNHAMKGMGEADKAAFAMQNFGQRAGPGFQVLLAASGDELRRFQKELENSAGVAQDIADKQLDNVYGGFVRLKSAVEGFNISVFETFKLPLKNYLNNAAKNVSKLTAKINHAVAAIKTVRHFTVQWIHENSRLLTGIGLVGAGVLALGIGIPTIAALTASFLKLGIAIMGVATTPVGALVAAFGVVAVGMAALTGNGETMTKRIGSGFATLGDFIRKVFATTQNLSATWARGFDAVAEGLLGAWNTVTESMTMAWLKMLHGMKSAYRDTGRWLLTAWAGTKSVMEQGRDAAVYETARKEIEFNPSISAEEKAGRLDILKTNYLADHRIKIQERADEAFQLAGIDDANKTADESQYKNAQADASKPFAAFRDQLASVSADRDAKLVNELIKDDGETPLGDTIKTFFKDMIPPEFKKKFEDALRELNFTIPVPDDQKPGKKTDEEGGGSPSFGDASGGSQMVGLEDLSRRIQEQALKDQALNYQRRQTNATETATKTLTKIEQYTKQWMDKYGDGRLEGPANAVYS